MQLEDLKTQFKGFIDRIDAMSLRERGLIFVTLLVALYFVAVNVLFGSVNSEKDRLQKQVNQLHEETRALESQVQVIAGGGENDPDTVKRKKIASLQENLKTMDVAFNRVTAGLVPPKEMSKLVEQMLLKNHGLEVIKVESLPSTPLLEGSAGGGSDGSMVYKHGMRIELKGSYLDILRYLRSLEGLEWKVFWGQVTLQTEKYPVSKVSLLIYTLSTHQGWIGL
jgi:MSHA biogenesis protein MshJ